MIAQKLARIEQYLAGRGIKLSVERRPPAEAADLLASERVLGRELPADLKSLYARFANGFSVFWQDCRSRTDFDFARFGVPQLESFVEQTLRFRHETLELHASAEDYFERANDARVVLDRMLKWGVLWDTGGDGDLVCIDFETGQVVFHEREWSFYEQYFNGNLIAPSLDALIDAWGNVCFVQFPGCPGDCPAHGESAVPDYSKQPYNMAGPA